MSETSTAIATTTPAQPALIPQGNVAAMREAVDEVLNKIDKWRTDGIMEHWQYSQLFDVCDAALAAPPRNCDVGTAREQEKRFDAFVQDRRGDLNCTGKCPAHNGVDFGVVACVLQWEQMPYEKGDSDANA